MAKLSELIKENYVKMLLYGEAGTGKSTLSFAFPMNMFVLDFDGKMRAAWEYWKDSRPDLLNTIEGVTLSMHWESGKPYDQFHQILTKLEALAREGKFPYKTIVIDSLTFFSKAMLGKSMTINSHKRATQGKPSFDDYAFIQKQFLSDMGRLFDLPCNILAIGHLKKTVDETNGSVTNTLLFDGAASSNYAHKLFREVYRSFIKMENNKPVHYLQTRPDGKYECRTSFKEMPAIIPMDFREIQKHWSFGSPQGDKK